MFRGWCRLPLSSHREPGEAAAQLTPDSTFDGNGLKVDVATRVTESANTPVSVTLKASKVWASAASSRDATFVIRRDRSASDAGADDFLLDPASIVITAGAREGTATLKVVADDEDERSEALVLVAVADDGDEAGELTFTLWDASVPL